MAIVVSFLFAAVLGLAVETAVRVLFSFLSAVCLWGVPHAFLLLFAVSSPADQGGLLLGRSFPLPCDSWRIAADAFGLVHWGFWIFGGFLVLLLPCAAWGTLVVNSLRACDQQPLAAGVLVVSAGLSLGDPRGRFFAVLCLAAPSCQVVGFLLPWPHLGAPWSILGGLVTSSPGC